MTTPRHMVQTLYNGVTFPAEGPNLDNVSRIDHGAMPMTIAMMRRGLQVDLSHFEKMDKQLTEDMERVTEEVHALTGYHVNLGSGPQVSDLLFKRLGLKQAKPKMTRGGARESVEHEVLVAIQHDHPAVGNILDYKELEKLRGTYVRPMPRLARRTKQGVWRLFPNLKMSRVPSGRYACDEPNLLAFPTRTSRGRQIRHGFITEPGWVYVSVDFSQFEPRACAHYSEDPDLMHIYQTEQDVYSDFAINAFALPDLREDQRQGPKGKWVYPGVDKDEHRFPSKTCFLAAIYDVTAGGLQEQMPIMCATCLKPTSADKEEMATHDPDTCTFAPLWTEDKCQTILNSLYLKYPGILKDRRRHHSRARQYGYIWDLWGRLHHIAAVRSVHPWVVSAALREAGNFPYQGLNSGALKLAMAALYDDLQAGYSSEVAHPLLPIHDEIVWEMRADVAEEIAEHTKWRFETVVELKVPVKAEWSQGNNWGESKG